MKPMHSSMEVLFNSNLDTLRIKQTETTDIADEKRSPEPGKSQLQTSSWLFSQITRKATDRLKT